MALTGLMTGTFNFGGDDEKIIKTKEKKRLKALREAKELIDKGCQFKPGDVVMQRAGFFEIYHFPEPGNPAVVLDVFERRTPERGAGQHVVHEDMEIAVFGKGGEGEYVRSYFVDSWRFESYE